MKTIYDLIRENKAKEYEVMALASAIGYLKNLVDTSDKSRFGVDKEHKEGVRIYVESWITPKLEDVLRSLLGDKGAKEYLKECVSRGYNDYAYDGYKDIIEDRAE